MLTAHIDANGYNLSLFQASHGRIYRVFNTIELDFAIKIWFIQQSRLNVVDLLTFLFVLGAKSWLSHWASLFIDMNEGNHE